MQLSDLINLAIAIFTAMAAKAAWDSAKSSHRAVEQANQSAEDGRKIAEEQTKALLTAAKSNALASRIEFYNRQISAAKGWLASFGTTAQQGYPEAKRNKELLEQEQEHLVRQLDQQTNALEVGLNYECPGSAYNDTIRARNRPGA